MNAECARVFERSKESLTYRIGCRRLSSFLGRFLRKAIMKSKSRLATLLVLIAAALVVSVTWSSQSLAGTTGGIQGYVTDPTGHPLAGVAVSAAAPSYATHTVTGPNGFYALNGLPLDTYTVSFSKAGYLEVTIPGATTTQDQSLRVDARMLTEAK